MIALSELGLKHYSGATAVNDWCPSVGFWHPFLSLFSHCHQFYINIQIHLVSYSFLIIDVYLLFSIPEPARVNISLIGGALPQLVLWFISKDEHKLNHTALTQEGAPFTAYRSSDHSSTPVAFKRKTSCSIKLS